MSISEDVYKRMPRHLALQKKAFEQLQSGGKWYRFLVIFGVFMVDFYWLLILIDFFIGYGGATSFGNAEEGIWAFVIDFAVLGVDF